MKYHFCNGKQDVILRKSKNEVLVRVNSSSVELEDPAEEIEKLKVSLFV